MRKRASAIAAIAGILVITVLAWERARWDQPAAVHLLNATHGTVARLSDLTTTPIPVNAPETDGVEYIARQQRFGGVNYLRLPFSVHPNPTALFLIRGISGAVRAYIAVDPISGCGLRWDPAATSGQPTRPGAFSDPCRGALYDVDGAVVGGPGFWELDQVEVAINGDSVLVYPSRVLVGRSAKYRLCRPLRRGSTPAWGTAVLARSPSNRC